MLQPAKTNVQQICVGNRDDLRIEVSRCLRVRFSESRCERCSAVCPVSAVSLDDGLFINPENCTGCLLCTSVCPSGALELSADFTDCLAQLAMVADPVLGCCRTKEQANSWLPCLGGASDEHLLTLNHRLTGVLTLNATRCGDCPNGAMLVILKKRLQGLADSGLSSDSCRLLAVESHTELRYQPETVDRRSFFKSFRSLLFQTAAAVIKTNTTQVACNSSYAGKRVPLRRELLNTLVNSLSGQQKTDIRNSFTHTIKFNDACTACQACVAICPTGALVSNNREQHPDFVQERCTGCGLCLEFCLDQAITMQSSH